MSFKSFSTELGSSKKPVANDAAKQGESHGQPANAAVKAPAGEKPATKT